MSIFSGIFSGIFSSSKDGSLTDASDYVQMLMAQLAQLNASKFAIQKCVGIISNAIAKSEIIIQGQQGLRYDENYYRLNVKPNENECGTEFWARASEKLLLNQECLIVQINGMYFLADSWTESDDVVSKARYENVTISAGKNRLSLQKKFKSDRVIHIRLPVAEKRMLYLKQIAALYDKAVSTAAQAYKLTYIPKYGLHLASPARLIEKTPDGSQKVITGAEYMAKIQTLLMSDDVASILLPEGITLEQLQLSSNTVTPGTLDDAVKASESACARAFDIPDTVYFGTITEKSDATNELITYAVGPVAEAINDALNAALVGMDDYVSKGERIMLFLARFKHVDIIESADKLDKMRADGWTLDEIFHLIGYPELHTDFTQTRALTKNYAQPDEDPSDSGSGASNHAKENPDGKDPERGEPG